MAIYIKVDENVQEKIVTQIKNLIDKKIIESWKYDNDGDFIYLAEQYTEHACIRPNISGHKLVFGMVKYKNYQIPKDIYSLFHGRFMEMLIEHANTDMIYASTKPDKQYDLIE